MLDVHSDAEHHRSVLTLGGPLDAVEAAARARGRRRGGRASTCAPTSASIPGWAPPTWCRSSPSPPRRPTATAVVPRSLEARDRFAAWAGAELGFPCFLYGPERSLPDVRRQAFRR